MRAVVTGGAGFIGSTLVDALVARGDEVLAVDDLSGGNRDNLAGAFDAGARLVEGDVRDVSFLAEQVDPFAPERIFHLAAQVDVRKAVADPAFDAEVNVLGTLNMLEAARRAGAGLVFASTGGAIYGEGEGRSLPFDESAEVVPEAPYGTSKYAAEVYLGLYRRLHGVPALALRFGNVYGPRQDPHGEAGVVAIFCGALREGRPLQVFGDGLQTRDYVFVDDIVASLLAAAAAQDSEGPELDGPFNVGTGVEASVLDLIEHLGASSGLDPEVIHRPERAGEVQRVSLDSSSAAERLGWSSQVGLGDGLGRTYEALAESA